MKKAKVYYKFDNSIVETSFVIETLEEYENGSQAFNHEPKTVKRLLKEGHKIIVNARGGYCIDCEDVKLLEVL